MFHFEFCNEFQDLFLSSSTIKTAQPSHFEGIHLNIIGNITVLITDSSPEEVSKECILSNKYQFKKSMRNNYIKTRNLYFLPDCDLFTHKKPTNQKIQNTQLKHFKNLNSKCLKPKILYQNQLPVQLITLLKT